jgi:hypothetical protein
MDGSKNRQNINLPTSHVYWQVIEDPSFNIYLIVFFFILKLLMTFLSRTYSNDWIFVSLSGINNHFIYVLIYIGHAILSSTKDIFIYIYIILFYFFPKKKNIIFMRNEHTY